MIERFIINEPGGAEVVFHLVLSLQDDGFGDELGTDQGRKDAAGDDHEKKAEHELGAQGKAAHEGDIRKGPQGIHVILSSIFRGKFEFIINNNGETSQ
jgi:hypothetical protein